MEHIYLIEFFINKINIRSDIKGKPSSGRMLTVHVNFGKLASFVVRQDDFEGEILVGDQKSTSDYQKVAVLRTSFEEDTVKAEEERTSLESILTDAKVVDEESVFDAGASILFSNKPENLIQTFKLFPLDLSVWNNDEGEKRACVGTAQFMWDTRFHDLVKRSHFCGPPKPLLIKQLLLLRSENTSSVIGDITFFVRLSAYGTKIFTRFMVINPGDDSSLGLYFRTSGGDASIKCERYGKYSTTVDMKTISPIYESIDIEDPDIVLARERRARVSQEMAGAGLDNVMFVVGNEAAHDYSIPPDFKSPCGNEGCKLTEMIKMYLAQKEEEGKVLPPPKNTLETLGVSRLRPKKPNTDRENRKMFDDLINTVGCCCLENNTGTDACSGAGAGGGVSGTTGAPCSAEEDPSFLVCDVCGGVSLTGKTCRGTEHSSAKNDCGCGTANFNVSVLDRQCRPPVFGDDKLETGRCNKDPLLQKCLYAGLSKMISCTKKEHKKYCPDYKHKQSCPARNINPNNSGWTVSCEPCKRR